MKIVHCCLCEPYNDNWGYQDNLLPKFQAKLGHSVTTITTNLIQKNGRIVTTDTGDYTLEDGVRVIRLKRKEYFDNRISNIRNKYQIFEILKSIKPDFIFFHSMISDSIFDAVKYKKTINPDCVIVQDNHLDENNDPKKRQIMKTLINGYYRFNYWRTDWAISKIYGVTPGRKDYAIKKFRLPEEKMDVLISGADDDYININEKNNIRRAIRKKYNIEENDFLIVTGGKIDSKKKILELMQAVAGIPTIKMIVFGSVAKEVAEKVKELSQKPNIINIGWIDSKEAYNYFLSADLVVFPGLHSVMWEQACACKVPCVFHHIPGIEHVNNGGNALLLDQITVDSLKATIQSLHFTDSYYCMKTIAESDKTDVFLYSQIAKKSLETVLDKK